MAITWPERFCSAPLREGYEQSKGSRLRRSNQPDAGPAKVRRIAGKRPDVINGTWVFTSYDKLKDFMDWIDDVDSGLAGGLYVFEWVHPMSLETMYCRIVPQSADILYSVGLYKNAFNTWSVSLKFEVLP